MPRKTWEVIQSVLWGLRESDVMVLEAYRKADRQTGPLPLPCIRESVYG